MSKQEYRVVSTHRHTGTTQPVDDEVLVRVRVAITSMFTPEPSPAYKYDWSLSGGIAEYQIVEPITDDGWIDWAGGECPVAPDTIVSVRFGDLEACSTTGAAKTYRWGHAGNRSDILAYKVVEEAPAAKPEASGGGKLSGNHYYRVDVSDPISAEIEPYTAECADIIEALGMTFNEGEAFKALWRLAAARQGRGKAGAKPQYDADKVAHYGARVAACVKRETGA